MAHPYLQAGGGNNAPGSLDLLQIIDDCLSMEAAVELEIKQKVDLV